MADMGMRGMARLWDELNRMGAAQSGRMAPSEDGSWTPPVDIHEREEAVVLFLDLPGVKKEDIELQVDATGLVLQGTRFRHPGGRDLRLERPVGRFRRSFRIGVPIEPGGTQASYRDGVLEITVPKAQRAGPTKVRVDVQ